MAAYRQVHISFWQDPYIEDLSPKEKYFYIYLMTNSKTKQCGCYEISMKLIKYETGLTQTEIDSYIEKLIEGKKIGYNKENQEFLLLNWLKHNSFKSPKVLACIKKELEFVKTQSFIDYITSFVDGEMTMDSLSIVYAESMDTQSQKEEEEEKKNNNKTKKEKNIFTPPTLQEVIDYCNERKNGVDAKRFYDSYNVSDWIDTQGNQVRNWKQKMIQVWEKKDTSPKHKPEQQGPLGLTYSNVGLTREKGMFEE